MRTVPYVAAAALVLLLTGCSPDESDPEPAAPTDPTTSASAGEEVEVVERYRPYGCELPDFHTDTEIVGHVFGSGEEQLEEGIVVRSLVDAPGAELGLEITRTSDECRGTARLTGGSGPDMDGTPRREVEALGMTLLVAAPQPSADVPNRAETSFVIVAQ